MKIIAKIKIFSHDTFFRGIFCGVVAGVLKDMIDASFFFSKLEKQFFWTFASFVAFGQLPKGFVMNLIGIILELIFSGLMGFIYTLLAVKIKTRHYLLLGIFYGSLIWFVIRLGIVSFPINELKIPETVARPISIWLLSLFYGLVLTWLERRLSPKTS